MAPEQLRSEPLTRRTDVYSAAVVLWETLTCRRLFRADNEGAVVTSILHGEIEPPSRAAPRDPGDAAAARAMRELDAVVLRGLDRDPQKRFATAMEMALALEACVPAATAATVGEWVRRVSAEALALRAKQVVEIESGISSAIPAVIEVKEGRPEAGVAVTQASSISVAKDSARTSGPSSRKILAIAAILVAIVAAVPLAGRLVEHAGGAPSGRAATPLPSASGADDTAAATPSSEPSSSDSAELPAASVPAVATAAPRPPSRHRAGTASPHLLPAPTAKDCNPPYYWDAQGKKHYKATCL